MRGFLDDGNEQADRLPDYAAADAPGKVIADFIIWGDGEDYLLDVAEGDAMPSCGGWRCTVCGGRLDRAGNSLAVHWSADGADDPRLAALGRRWIAPPDGAASGWLEHRLRLGVCEGAELTDLLWLECNAAALNGVSFSKGCFVGQENTARMNWRAKVNRRLLVVEGDGGTRVRMAYPELGLRWSTRGSMRFPRVRSFPHG